MLSRWPTSDTSAAKAAPPAGTPSAVPPSPAAPEYAATDSHIPPLDSPQPAPTKQTAPAKSARPSCQHGARQELPDAHGPTAARPETAPPTAQFSRKSRPAADTAASSPDGSTSRADASRPPRHAAHAALPTGSDRGKGLRMHSSYLTVTLDGITQQKSASHENCRAEERSVIRHSRGAHDGG